jgi:hypothetical protein
MELPAPIFAGLPRARNAGRLRFVRAGHLPLPGLAAEISLAELF